MRESRAHRRMRIECELYVVERTGKVVSRRKNVDAVVSTSFDHAIHGCQKGAARNHKTAQYMLMVIQS